MHSQIGFAGGGDECSGHQIPAWMNCRGAKLAPGGNQVFRFCAEERDWTIYT